MSNKHDEAKAFSCLFCREPAVSGEENRKRLMKRLKASDPNALNHIGVTCMLEGDYGTALNYLTKAAELGDIDAHAQLGGMYLNGDGVEKDEEKEVYHYEQAAISGNPHARNDLADYELRNGNIERAVKHFIIAANLGSENSMKELWSLYAAGNISKKDLDATLRSHQAALDATKSAERDAANYSKENPISTKYKRMIHKRWSREANIIK
jgi:TPR repeat protein